MRRLFALTLVAVMALGVIGFAQPGSSPDEPIYMLLVPSTEGATVEAVGQAIAEAIFDLTGLYVVASLQADYTAMIEAFAASEGDTFGLPTTDQYIRIFERTGGNVSPRLGSVRYGYPWYYASVYARRDSGIAGLEDLDGKVWIYNDTGSTSGYVFPNMVFETAGLEFASIVTTGGHTNSMVALIEGQGDFCTGYGSAPGAPDGWEGDRWDFGDDPEMWLWDRWNGDLFREAFLGTCYDLRRAVRSTYDFDTVLTDIGVVLNIGPIPNDCLAFGPNFPVAIADQIVEAIKIHIATEEGAALWGDENFYEWTAVADIDDSFYDEYRVITGRTASIITDDDIIAGEPVEGTGKGETIEVTGDNRQVFGKGGNDTIRMKGGGTYEANGGPDDDNIESTGAGTATLNGDEGNDTITANHEGKATIDLGEGKNTARVTSKVGICDVAGGSGDDTISVNSTGTTTVRPGAGTNTVTVGSDTTDVTVTGHDGATNTVRLPAKDGRGNWARTDDGKGPTRIYERTYPVGTGAEKKTVTQEVTVPADTSVKTY